MGPTAAHHNKRDLQAVLLGITCTSALVLRRGDVETVAQGELDATGVVVLLFANHQTVAIERETIDATVEEVVPSQFDIEPALEEILADAEREYRVSAIEPCILLVAVGMHAKVSLQQPIVRKRHDVG